MKVEFEKLISCAREIFEKAGVPGEEAQIVAEELAMANMMGVDSHGVLRIPQYLDEMKSGQIKPGASLEIVKETPVTAILDCKQNFGQVGARKMVDIVEEKAKKNFMACALSLNANHIGRLGSYTEELARRGLIAFGTVGVYLSLIHIFRGAKSLQEKLFSLDNVEVIWDTVVKEIRGEDAVSGIVLENVKTGETEEKDVQGVFIAVGILPETEAYKGLVEMDKAGYIVAGEDGITSVPGIFAAGDIRTKKLRQIVTAASDGANAVTAAEQYLNLQKV